MPELARLCWEEARDALARARLAILAAGSCEQHGPHMTLDSDLAIAEALARRLAGDLGADAVLCPSVGYGLSEHHLGFHGTLTLRPETFVRLLSDVVESLAHWGLRRVLVVNGHGGNIDALRLLARQARRDHGVLVAAVMWAQLAADEAARHAAGPRYGHACEIETSLGMALAPQTVRRERIGPPGDLPSREPLGEPPFPRVDLAVPLHEWTRTGAVGDARKASLQIGEAVARTAHERALAFARRFATQPLPGVSPGVSPGEGA
jgi:creatinine amidohydrolase